MRNWTRQSTLTVFCAGSPKTLEHVLRVLPDASGEDQEQDARSQKTLWTRESGHREKPKRFLLMTLSFLDFLIFPVKWSERTNMKNSRARTACWMLVVGLALTAVGSADDESMLP